MNLDLGICCYFEFLLTVTSKRMTDGQIYRQTDRRHYHAKSRSYRPTAECEPDPCPTLKQQSCTMANPTEQSSCVV